jgi:hypothetical protein
LACERTAVRRLPPALAVDHPDHDPRRLRAGVPRRSATAAHSSASPCTARRQSSSRASAPTRSRPVGIAGSRPTSLPRLWTND